MKGPQVSLESEGAEAEAPEDEERHEEQRIQLEVVEDEVPRIPITASDVERYSYCPLSWWLHLQGEEGKGEELERGVESHEELGQKAEKIRIGELRARQYGNVILGYAAIILSLIFNAWAFFSTRSPNFLAGLNPLVLGNVLVVISVMWLFMALLKWNQRVYKEASQDDEPTGVAALLAFEDHMAPEVIMDRSEELRIASRSLAAILLAFNGFILMIFGQSADQQDGVAERVFLGLTVLAVIWTLAALTILRGLLITSEQSEELREALRLDRDESVTGSDLLDTDQSLAGVLSSQAENLRGKPDHLLRTGDFVIPVENKTGRVPRGPLFSHIMQLFAYCFLIEETTGRAPPYGVINYAEERRDEINYDGKSRDLLLDKMSEMRVAHASRDVHRNHRRPGKCRNCSRRSSCPERLVGSEVRPIASKD